MDLKVMVVAAVVEVEILHLKEVVQQIKDLTVELEFSLEGLTQAVVVVQGP
jgi:hypothetical protein